MTVEEDSDEDGERSEAVLKAALLATEDAFVPMEVIVLVTLLDGGIDRSHGRLKPADAVIAAYLLGRCDGDVEKLEEITREWKKRPTNTEKADGSAESK